MSTPPFEGPSSGPDPGTVPEEAAVDNAPVEPIPTATAPEPPPPPAPLFPPLFPPEDEDTSEDEFLNLNNWIENLENIDADAIIARWRLRQAAARARVEVEASSSSSSESEEEREEEGEEEEDGETEEDEVEEEDDQPENEEFEIPEEEREIIERCLREIEQRRRDGVVSEEKQEDDLGEPEEGEIPEVITREWAIELLESGVDITPRQRREISRFIIRHKYPLLAPSTSRPSGNSHERTEPKQNESEVKEEEEHDDQQPGVSGENQVVAKKDNEEDVKDEEVRRLDKNATVATVSVRKFLEPKKEIESSSEDEPSTSTAHQEIEKGIYVYISTDDEDDEPDKLRRESAISHVKRQSRSKTLLVMDKQLERNGKILEDSVKKLDGIQLSWDRFKRIAPPMSDDDSDPDYEELSESSDRQSEESDDDDEDMEDEEEQENSNETMCAHEDQEEKEGGEDDDEDVEDEEEDEVEDEEVAEEGDERDDDEEDVDDNEVNMEEEEKYENEEEDERIDEGCSWKDDDQKEEDHVTDKKNEEPVQKTKLNGHLEKKTKSKAFEREKSELRNVNGKISKIEKSHATHPILVNGHKNSASQDIKEKNDTESHCDKVTKNSIRSRSIGNDDKSKAAAEKETEKDEDADDEAESGDEEEKVQEEEEDEEVEVEEEEEVENEDEEENEDNETTVEYECDEEFEKRMQRRKERMVARLEEKAKIKYKEQMRYEKSFKKTERLILKQASAVKDMLIHQISTLAGVSEGIHTHFHFERKALTKELATSSRYTSYRWLADVDKAALGEFVPVNREMPVDEEIEQRIGQELENRRLIRAIEGGEDDDEDDDDELRKYSEKEKKILLENETLHYLYNLRVDYVTQEAAKEGVELELEEIQDLALQNAIYDYEELRRIENGEDEDDEEEEEVEEGVEEGVAEEEEEVEGEAEEEETVYAEQEQENGEEFVGEGEEEGAFEDAEEVEEGAEFEEGVQLQEGEEFEEDEVLEEGEEVEVEEESKEESVEAEELEEEEDEEEEDSDSDTEDNAEETEQQIELLPFEGYTDADSSDSEEGEEKLSCIFESATLEERLWKSISRSREKEVLKHLQEPGPSRQEYPQWQIDKFKAMSDEKYEEVFRARRAGQRLDEDHMSTSMSQNTPKPGIMTRTRSGTPLSRSVRSPSIITTPNNVREVNTSPKPSKTRPPRNESNETPERPTPQHTTGPKYARRIPLNLDFEEYTAHEEEEKEIEMEMEHEEVVTEKHVEEILVEEVVASVAATIVAPVVTPVVAPIIDPIIDPIVAPIVAPVIAEETTNDEISPVVQEEPDSIISTSSSTHARMQRKKRRSIIPADPETSEETPLAPSPEKKPRRHYEKSASRKEKEAKKAEADAAAAAAETDATAATTATTATTAAEGKDDSDEDGEDAEVAKTPVRKRGYQQKTPRRKGSSAVKNVDEKLYCSCKKVSFGEMVGCDNSKCLLEWFHFTCVGITAKPKGKWYCPDCRHPELGSTKSKTSNSSRPTRQNEKT